MKVALLQLCSTDDPAGNTAIVTTLMHEAAVAGADFVLTPEVTNCVSQDREHQSRVLQKEENDKSLATLRQTAKDVGVWLSIGSLALKTDDADGRFANRSFLIDPQGKIVARYDKIHMFDVSVSETERYHESKGYRPGARAVLADIGMAKLGMSICYDVRFPSLYRALAQAGANVFLVPSAFAVTTGKAHWETLLRARAIENGCFVLAAAQSGQHPAQSGRPRMTYGHSLVVSPWGEVIADAGTATGMTLVDLDLAEVAKARHRVPSLQHDRVFEGP